MCAVGDALPLPVSVLLYYTLNVMLLSADAKPLPRNRGCGWGDVYMLGIFSFCSFYLENDGGICSDGNLLL
jgi:hypothetical protein